MTRPPLAAGLREKNLSAGMMENLNREEKAVLTQYLEAPRPKLDTFFAFGTYIFPSLVFAIYGTLKMDFAAVAVAYLALLIAANCIWVTSGATWWPSTPR